MSSSGLIYAVIVGAWAAYLVPMWLRRQDELNEARPTERFSTAIRLLSGRAALERKYAKTADPESEAEAEPAVDVRALAVPATEVKPKSRQNVKAGNPGKRAKRGGTANPGKANKPNPRAKVLAARRRTITLLFLGFTAGMIVAAVGGVAFLWAPAAPAVLLTFYIAYLRAQERRRFEVKIDQRRAADAAKRLREARTTREPVAEAPDANEPAPPAEEPATADRRALVEQTDHAEWVDQQRIPAEDTWEVPAPRPTFSTAPVTPRRSRDRSRTPLFDQQADRDRPRAANE
ncbi:divisome protein SepX/GlpR [Actinacidiphila sp. bgisy160]|uniref:divisome protein SepX/GlpR n=1 Tax=Actinacidiphila sp. bgisy160 TaxID=3413796 RepID=UPI003D718B99